MGAGEAWISSRCHSWLVQTRERGPTAKASRIEQGDRTEVAPLIAKILAASQPPGCGCRQTATVNFSLANTAGGATSLGRRLPTRERCALDSDATSCPWYSLNTASWGGMSNDDV